MHVLSPEMKYTQRKEKARIMCVCPAGKRGKREIEESNMKSGDSSWGGGGVQDQLDYI